MNKTMKALNRNWRAISIAVAAAGVLVYPAIKLVQFLAKKISGLRKTATDTMHRVKAFSPRYRGRHKIHPRHLHNGHEGHSKS